MKLIFVGVVLVFLLFFWLPPSKCSKILILIPISSKSHKAPLEFLGNELAKRGHEITVVSCFKPSKVVPRVKTVFLSDVNVEFGAISKHALNLSTPSFGMIFALVNISERLCRAMYTDPAMKGFLESPGQYDVILSIAIFSDCYLGLSQKLGAPLVLFSTSVLLPHTAWNMNVPSPASYIPVMSMASTQEMSFGQRLKNVLITGASLALLQLYVPWAIDGVARDYVPDVISSIEATTNASLVFVNSHFALEDPRPTVPNVIEVGGLQCRPAEKLPQEFEDFVQGSKENGFIVFSLGSVVESQYLPADLLNTFKSVFAQLKQRVIWKFEKPLEGLSPNVLISSWIPQQDLIGHPKCKLAITHGGILSVQEVAYHGVPSLGVPLGADRDQNYARAVQKGFALTIDWLTVTPEILLRQINELLTNPKYKQKAMEISTLMKDRPQSVLDTAVFWMEYVIRHRGAPHLRIRAGNLNLFQYFCLDVFAVLIGGVAFVVFILVLIIKVVLRLLRRRRIEKAKTN